MKPEDCELVAQLCAARAGLRVDPEKTYLIESRLGPVARREGYGSVSELIAALKTQREDRLIWAIVEAMASAETSFLRDKPVFEYFRTEVLPTLARRREGQPIRVWSAACGSGQEVYSLAMILDEERSVVAQPVKVELFASDLSERALEKAQTGLYTQFEIQRGLPIRQLLRHFEKADEMWALSPRIRQMVRWRRINLISDLSAAGRFDVIFCRYVFGTLTEAARPRLLENLTRALTPDGYLFLGQGEAAQGLGEAFDAVPGHPGLFARNPAFRVAA